MARTLAPLEIVQSWSLQLVGAMQAINERVIHRDLKPDNVLFLNETLKVADFGLAKLVGAATRTVTFKGGQHVLYMAPEAWEGARNDIQIDMYAAGIVLFQLSTLRFPYDVPPNDANLDAFRRMHLLQTPKASRVFRPDLPQRYSEVINRLLSKRPESRYRVWVEVESAIHAAFAPTSAPVQAGHLSVSSLLEQADQRHRQATEQRLAAEAKEPTQNNLINLTASTSLAFWA